MKFEIKEEQIEKLLFPFIEREYEKGSFELRLLHGRKEFKFILERIKYFFLNIISKNCKRDVETVKKQYDDSWKRAVYSKNQYSSFYPIKIGNRYFNASSVAIARIHLFCIKNIIDFLKPDSIAEIGFGNGSKLLPLSFAFPEKFFSGIELSESGFEQTRKNIANNCFPDYLKDIVPFSLNCHKTIDNIEIFNGSAENLPFADRSYDLIYTSQALEQMESIRDQVMFEISRVSKKHVLMIEPFRDWNEKGMCRNKIITKNYFQARIADIYKYGLRPIYINNNLPSKIYMQVGIVIAEII